MLLCWCLVQVLLFFTYPLSDRPTPVISWDRFGYYIYLPAFFIYHDPWQLKFAEPMMHQYSLCEYFYAAFRGPTGNYVMNYSLGTAILYFPFFVLGHLVAFISNYPRDGFSAPYQYAIAVCGSCYSLLGVVVTMRNLRFFFSEKLTALLIVILILGTNYFFYATIENAMTHGYLFTIGALVIYFTIKWHAQQRAKYAVLLGVFTGLAIVIRPTEVLWCLVPLMWGVYNLNSLKQKWQLVVQNIPQLLLLVLSAFLVGCIQMAYWKAASGKFIYYSYDGHFDFLSPNIWLGLFSIEKGWLVYTPLIVLALTGLPLLWLKHKQAALVCLIYIVSVVYLTFSWEAWQYGGGFGSRPMVPTYALLLLPMGVTLSALRGYLSLQIILVPLIGFFIFLNLFQTWQYLHEFFSHEGPDAYKYKVVFLRTQKNKQIIREYFGLEQLTKPATDSTIIYPAGSALPDSLRFPRSPYDVTDAEGKIVFDSAFHTGRHSYIRIDANAMFEPFIGNSDKLSYLSVSVQSANLSESTQEYRMPLQPLIGNNSINWERDLYGVPGVWDNVFMYVPVLPESQVKLRMVVKNPSGNHLFFKDLRLWLLK